MLKIADVPGLRDTTFRRPAGHHADRLCVFPVQDSVEMIFLYEILRFFFVFLNKSTRIATALAVSRIIRVRFRAAAVDVIRTAV